MTDEEWLGDAAARVDRLLGTMTTAELRLLRDALTLDLAHGGDPDFIQARLAAIDAILAQRGRRRD